ncbi:TPA: glucokinase [Candidatus Latescibacteria bacterium]|nr:glucokinase [Candidatus Latescibacterota bacterium]
MPAIGIDLGGTDIKGAVISDEGRILHQDLVSTQPESGADGVADRIVGLVGSLCDTHGVTLDSTSGVGVGVPGVTRKDGTVVIAPNLDWHHVPFRQMLQDRLTGSAVELDNDANVAALAEAKAGVGAGCDSLAFLTLGTGIGGGIVVDGRVHHGASYSAGEIGHMVVIPDGPLCGCGKSGCLEAISATKGMISHAEKLIDDGFVTSLKKEDLTPKSICDAAAEGDEIGEATVDHVARHIGIAVANLINILSPEVIAIGGGISAAGSLMLDPIAASAETNTLEGMFEHTRIELARLGNDAGSIGAAYLVMS